MFPVPILHPPLHSSAATKSFTAVDIYIIVFVVFVLLYVGNVLVAVWSVERAAEPFGDLFCTFDLTSFRQRDLLVASLAQGSRTGFQQATLTIGKDAEEEDIDGDWPASCTADLTVDVFQPSKD